MISPKLLEYNFADSVSANKHAVIFKLLTDTITLYMDDNATLRHFLNIILKIIPEKMIGEVLS